MNDHLDGPHGTEHDNNNLCVLLRKCNFTFKLLDESRFKVSLLDDSTIKPACNEFAH